MKNKLLSDHRELDKLLEEFLSVLASGSAADALETLDRFWARLAMHIRAEHLHLFPAILAASKTKSLHGKTTPETIDRTIKELHEDHDFFMRELAAAIKIMREIKPLMPDDTKKRLLRVQKKVSAVTEKLKIHNELEETKVYQWAEHLLIPAECWVLDMQIQKELENLPPRFGKY